MLDGTSTTILGKVITDDSPLDKKHFLADLLLQKGADANMISDRRPPLFWALFRNDYKLAKLLIKYNADPFRKIVGLENKSVLYLLYEFQNTKAINFLKSFYPSKHFCNAEDIFNAFDEKNYDAFLDCKGNGLAHFARTKEKVWIVNYIIKNITAEKHYLVFANFLEESHLISNDPNDETALQTLIQRYNEVQTDKTRYSLQETKTLLKFLFGIAKSILDSAPELVNAVSERNKSPPLLMAVRALTDAHLPALLVKHGANPNELVKLSFNHKMPIIAKFYLDFRNDPRLLSGISFLLQIGADPYLGGRFSLDTLVKKEKNQNTNQILAVIESTKW